MSKSAHISIALVVVLLATSLAASRVTAYPNIGVQVGDYSDYSLTTMTNYAYHTLGRYRVLVDNISTWSVPDFMALTLNLTLQLSNGTWLSTDTGHLYLGNWAVITSVPFEIMWIVPANLVEGQYVNYPLAINETTQLLVAGALRTVNHLKITTGNYQPDIYWDKATGVLVKGNTLNNGVWTNITILATNMWNADSPAWSVLAGAALLVAAFVTVALVAAGKKRS